MATVNKYMSCMWIMRSSCRTRSNLQYYLCGEDMHKQCYVDVELRVG